MRVGKKDNIARGEVIRKMFFLLEEHFGDLGWWPARSRFEVIVGAVLTQNTSWRNVENAIRELKRLGLLNLKALRHAGGESVQKAIRCTGYFRQKTERLKRVCEFFAVECGDHMKKRFSGATPLLRQKLLSIKGIGPETADSILLYAFQRPVFVVDAYTIRIFQRHSVLSGEKDYNSIQEMVHTALGLDVRMFNQFHALIVETGKRFCLKKEAKCEICPLKGLLRRGFLQ
ncbi:MAG TPA: hypothetical protein PKZ41_01610 [Candidatus Omnitrophota bacterium]|nr:hypothetical protein [Candidatus Omnitrophota bacterium]